MFAATMVTIALSLASGSTGWQDTGHTHGSRYAQRTTKWGRFLAPGAGNGWGFPNNNPDGYGWFDFGTALPVGPDRVPEYFFPRYFAVPADQMFFPTYYNAYVSRGQRYLPYANCGGEHPVGGIPFGSAVLPPRPYEDTIGNGPRVQIPPYNGRVEAPPINSGTTGLTP